MNEKSHITGTLINYYFHCHRQLWLFHRHIKCEQESDTVYLGKVIHEHSYEREHKELEIDELKLDFFDLRDGVLHEVKKSDKWREAHEWQVLYYLYMLKKKGIDNIRGELNYPMVRQTVSVELTPEKETALQQVIQHIEDILAQKLPPPIEVRKSLCRTCSYYELCYI
ncbi:CRISPR-associated protein Cas4 [candidate division KSB1 bacterium]|nr:CRISPR-associated protein Cas4 [candidate division KSB1 bacterium]